ncbi:MAG: zinc-finger domain-containing protein [Pseudomonadota bacterium]
MMASNRASQKQASKINSADDTITIAAYETQVACDGGADGHPRVFYTFASGQREVVCQYCGRRFIRAAPS